MEGCHASHQSSDASTPEFFHAPCRKNCIGHQFLVASKSSITMHSFGKIVLRAPAIGAKTWRLYVFFSVTLRGRPALRSRVTYFEQVLCRCLWVDFDTVYIVFSIDCPLKGTSKSELFLLLGGATIFAKLRSKNFII